MALQDLLARLAAVPGTSQADRDDPRLQPAQAPLDERDTAALLAAARALARHVGYFETDPDDPQGKDWQAFFPDGDLAPLVDRTDGQVPPHLALLIAFLRIGAGAQRLLNGFTGQHLRFQMEQVLGFVPRAPQPDHAHLVLELKKGAAPVLIDERQRFSAGPDAAKVEQLFAPVRPVVIGTARVAQLCSLRRDDGLLRFAPLAASADGLGAPLDAQAPAWPPFGRADAPPAPVGFAIASPLLRLAEGQRSVQLVLQLSGLDERHTDAALTQSLHGAASGPKGWVAFQPRATRQGDRVTLAFTLAPADPPLVDHDPALHLQRFPAGMPVVQLLLEPAGSLPFGAFDGVSLHGVQVVVDVQGLRSLAVENDDGRLDAKKAFLPFGSQPTVGSRLLIGCPEALSKRLTALAVHLRWQGDPDLAARYANYKHGGQVKDGVGATLAWQDARNPLQTTAELDLMHLVDGVTTLGPSVAPLPPAWSPANRVRALAFSGAGIAQRAAKVQALLLPVSAFVPGLPPAEPPAGFITVTLNQDFLHEDYRKEAIEGLTKPTPVVLREPYTPKVQQIWLDYGAQSDESRLDAADATAFTDTEVQFFQVDAFGISREHAWLAQQRPWGRAGAPALLPPHDDAGELCIGLEGVAPGDPLSLLLQAVDGSADPQAHPQPVRWSVLADDAWRALAPDELSLDTTRDLRASGLAAFVLPGATTTQHSRLAPGLVWLRAAVPAEPQAACDLVGVHANALEVAFADQGNAPGRLASPLPAGAIARMKVPPPQLKGVAQPYASFGGELAETPAALARRAAERARHRGRAINAWDAERLALQAFPSLYRAKCIPHASDTSWLAAGHARLVVVPRLHNRNAVDRLQPRVDLDTLQRIQALLTARGGQQVQWHVGNPSYRGVRLDFKVRLRPGQSFNFCRGLLNRALVDLLSPWASDPKAPLAFGGRVVRSALLDFVEDQPCVDFVTDFRLFVEGDGRDVAEASAGTPDAILVSVPEHTIVQINDPEAPGA